MAEAELPELAPHTTSARQQAIAAAALPELAPLPISARWQAVAAAALPARSEWRT